MKVLESCAVLSFVVLSGCGGNEGASASASGSVTSAPPPKSTSMVVSGKPSSTPTASATASATVATDCTLKPRTKAKGCPDTKAAEAAWKKVETTCKLDVATDIKPMPDEVRLSAAAHDKICASCECANNVQDYTSIYSDCTDKTEKENANMGKALAAEVDKCGFKAGK